MKGARQNNISSLTVFHTRKEVGVRCLAYTSSLTYSGLFFTYFSNSYFYMFSLYCQSHFIYGCYTYDNWCTRIRWFAVRRSTPVTGTTNGVYSCDLISTGSRRDALDITNFTQVFTVVANFNPLVECHTEKSDTFRFTPPQFVCESFEIYEYARHV